MLWGLFLINIWGLEPLVAVMAIAIPFGAIVAKVFSEIWLSRTCGDNKILLFVGWVRRGQ
jgi:ABC-type phosphate/phosphonate transport system permease subunit